MRKYDMIIFKYEITGSEVYTVCTETLYFNNVKNNMEQFQNICGMIYQIVQYFVMTMEMVCSIYEFGRL